MIALTPIYKFLAGRSNEFIKEKHIDYVTSSDMVASTDSSGNLVVTQISNSSGADRMTFNKSIPYGRDFEFSVTMELDISRDEAGCVDRLDLFYNPAENPINAINIDLVNGHMKGQNSGLFGIFQNDQEILLGQVNYSTDPVSSRLMGYQDFGILKNTNELTYFFKRKNGVLKAGYEVLNQPDYEGDCDPDETILNEITAIGIVCDRSAGTVFKNMYLKIK